MRTKKVILGQIPNCDERACLLAEEALLFAAWLCCASLLYPTSKVDTAMSVCGVANHTLYFTVPLGSSDSISLFFLSRHEMHAVRFVQACECW